MLRWIFALLLIPFLDAVLLAVIVSQTTVIGWIGMVLLVVLTGLVGTLLVRAEGRRTLRKMQRTLAQGKLPTNELLDGGLLIAAGAFLLTPGLVTDLVGFLFVVPITRVPIRAGLKRYVIIPYADKKTGGFASGAVWTYGFPDDGDNQRPTESDPADSGSIDGNIYDLGDDAYTVDNGDSSSGDGSTTDLGESGSGSDEGDSNGADRFVR